jgi:pilus assembly protein CpaE
MAGKRILIIDMEAASRSFVGAALQKEGYQTLEAASGREGLIVAWRDHPDLLIVDPDLTDLRGEILAMRLRQDARTAHTPLIALSSDPQPARIRSALEAGFAEYLVKTAQVMPALMETVNRLVVGKASSSTKQAEGRLIVFLSAKGGTGTSSLCANIATNIALYKPDKRVAVMDMVLPIGSIADIVGYQGDLNLVSIAEMPPETFTPDFFLNNLAGMKPWHFHLMAGSPDPESGNRLKVVSMADMVNSMKTAFDYVLVDVGRSLSRISMPLIETADLIAVIVNTDSSTITLTKTVWEYLQIKGVEASSVYVILNRAVGLEGMTRAEAEKILKLEIKKSMPYQGSNLALANNQHQPFTQKYPDNTNVIIFREMAKEMAELADRHVRKN